jgi:CheY-like chemotaxis protein
MAERGPAGPRVLLVDDDTDNLVLLREVLEDEGIVVVGEATEGGTAVELTERLRPDVVLMDLRMPGMPALEATRLIRLAEPPPEVIILTAYEGLVREPAETSGAFAYMLKGCSVQLMHDMIFQAWRRALEGRAPGSP